jgi:hypothetical protein
MVHTAVKPVPGMEIAFTVEPIEGERPQRRRREKP